MCTCSYHNITISMPLGAQPDSAVGALMVVLGQGLHAERDKAAAATSSAKIDFKYCFLSLEALSKHTPTSTQQHIFPIAASLCCFQLSMLSK